jgi:hypothetical protein
LTSSADSELTICNSDGGSWPSGLFGTPTSMLHGGAGLRGAALEHARNGLAADE